MRGIPSNLYGDSYRIFFSQNILYQLLCLVNLRVFNGAELKPGSVLSVFDIRMSVRTLQFTATLIY